MVATTETLVEVYLVKDVFLTVIGAATAIGLAIYLLGFMVAMMWITIQFMVGP